MRKFFAEKKLPKIFILILIIVILALFYFYVIDVDRKSDLDAVTSTEPAVFSDKRFDKKLSSNPDYELIYSLYSSTFETGISAYVIPGLKEMKTLNLYTEEIDSCEDMTPQGLAVTDEYLIVSMYCYKQDHNSMLVLINKTTGAFVKEIPLKGRPHCGGLAYDSDKNVLWVSGYANGTAYANGISMKAIREYDSSAMSEPIEYTYQEPLTELKRNSFMTYKDNTVFAGYFDMESNSIIQKYNVKSNASLSADTKINTSNTEKKESFTFPESELFAFISSKIQGMSFMENTVLLTQSYGLEDSKLLVSDDIDIVNGLNDLTDDNILGEYTLPDRMECVVYADGKLYLLFESGAKAYRHRTHLPMDRIITIDIYDEESSELML